MVVLGTGSDMKTGPLKQLVRQSQVALIGLSDVRPRRIDYQSV